MFTNSFIASHLFLFTLANKIYFIAIQLIGHPSLFQNFPAFCYWFTSRILSSPEREKAGRIVCWSLVSVPPTVTIRRRPTGIKFSASAAANEERSILRRSTCWRQSYSRRAIGRGWAGTGLLIGRRTGSIKSFPGNGAGCWCCWKWWWWLADSWHIDVTNCSLWVAIGSVSGRTLSAPYKLPADGYSWNTAIV